MKDEKRTTWNVWIPSPIGIPLLFLAMFIGWQFMNGWSFFDRWGKSEPEAAPAFNESLWIVKAQESVRARLRDPDSAEFRDVGIHQKNGAPIVCGQVNSRNGFGGMRGFQSFVFAGSIGTFLAEDMKAGEMKKVWQEMCAG